MKTAEKVKTARRCLQNMKISNLSVIIITVCHLICCLQAISIWMRICQTEQINFIMEHDTKTELCTLTLNWAATLRCTSSICIFTRLPLHSNPPLNSIHSVMLTHTCSVDGLVASKCLSWVCLIFIIPQWPCFSSGASVTVNEID